MDPSFDFFLAVVPNLPFFFCVWRSWSHYKGTENESWSIHICLNNSFFFLEAYRSTQYLQDLLSHDSIFPEANEALDAVWREFSSPVSTQDAGCGSQFVLTSRAVPAIANLFDLGETSHADMCRAIDQARLLANAKNPTS